MNTAEPDSSALTPSLTQPQMTKAKNLQKAPTEKEIVSAMVRLNTQGLKVPVKLDELKKLPSLAQQARTCPNSSTMKKKSFTDMGPGNNYLGLQEACEEVDEDTDDQHDVFYNTEGQ